MKKTTIASLEGNQKYLDFTLSRLNIYKSQIEIYKIEQQEINESDLKLLKFLNLERAKHTDESAEGDNCNEQKRILFQRVNFIKRKIDILQKVRRQLERELYLDDELNRKNGLSDDQVKEAQLNKISQEPDKYSNLVLNLDYELNLTQESRSKDGYDVEQWFNLQKVDFRTQATIYAADSKQNFYRWIQIFQNKNEYQHLYLYIHGLETETEFFQFDDFISTLKMFDICFQTVTIDVQFENNLCILALLRSLMSINRFNILNITTNSSFSYKRKKIYLQQVGDLIESIFTVIFSHRHLQGIKLQLPPESFDFLHKITQQINAKKSQLKVYCQASDYKFANSSKVSDYFQFLAQIPHLAHISQYAIPIRTEDAANNLNFILKKVQSACLNLITVLPQFNFEFYFSNLKHLNLELSIDPQMFSNQNLENLLLSLKEAKMLTSLKLYFYNCVYYPAQETPKSQAFNQLTEIKREENSEIKGETHRNNVFTTKIKNQFDGQQQVTQNINQNLNTYTHTPIQKVNSMKLFDNLSELTELEDFNITIQATQEIYDSLHKLLIKSIRLKKFQLKLNQAQKQNKIVDLGNIYKTLNDLKQVSVKIETENICVSYQLLNEYSNFYFFDLKLSQESNEFKQIFNQYEFQFENIKQIRIQQKYLENLENLNVLCKSLSSCDSLKNIQLIVHLNYNHNLLKNIQRQPINMPELLFFKQFEYLKQLENIYIDCVVDQHILNSISEFLENCQLIKSFILKKQDVPQYYLDYSNIFKSLQKLPQLNQVFVSYQSEYLKISDKHKQAWEKHKLNTFYQPLCEFIKESSQTLQLIDLDERQIDDQPLTKILQSLIDSKFHHYVRINPFLQQTIIQQKDKKYYQLLEACNQKGLLVQGYFKFPLSQPTDPY
ncbi:telomerase component p95 (macronuclear) [Tetrahymena thermophila SB210]|uniref:Telomerase component p95 n=1 Tax=Tetrahymena thermophila (strain SB210) TaxID=312017 RepID=Q233W4_TETTS|nr:telomerase component p95 [Tetrahymena thermophila SB210]EAR91820.1 telomerase component p95 [Tetrahymena thermophila SB210]|eukprot:XP_001012065.1 telomerase component p95 [Tetrahymena thermophila SB210]